MDTKKLYTVWSARRDKKTIILVPKDEPDLYETIILKASQKLEIDGSSLVLESNGTPLDAEVLPYVYSEILILLAKDEQWSSAKTSCSSLPSTVTVESSLGTSHSENENHNVNDIQSVDITYNVNCNTEYHWSSIQIPWDKLSSDKINELNSGIKNRATITSLLHATVDEMRCIKHIIPTKAFKIVGKKIIDKYPELFRDIDEDGVVLGDGSHSIVCKLQDRNNYLNRPHKRKCNSPNPVMNKKRHVAARAGCLNWAPNINNNQFQPMEVNVDETDQNFYDILEKTYSEQRNFINNLPQISEVKEKWPILFSKLAIYWHFNKLTNSDIHLINDTVEKNEKLNNFLNEKLKENSENIEEVPNLKVIIRKLCLYFKEDINYILRKYKILEEVNLTDIPVTPCIIEIDPEVQPIYFVYFERQQINLEGYETFIEALKVCFSLYFIFNLQYPKEISTLLELIQRMYLKIHPDAGSKSKKVTPTKKKVFNFMNRFKDFSD